MCRRLIYHQGIRQLEKAVEKFTAHSNSKTHKLACQNLIQNTKSSTVDLKLNSQLKIDQDAAKNALYKIITSLRYLAERGLAVRGHENNDGNFVSLLNLRADDDENLKKWLERSRKNYQAPARAGADPKKILRLRERQGLYMQQQRGCFSAVTFGGFQLLPPPETSYTRSSCQYDKTSSKTACRNKT